MIIEQECEPVNVVLIRGTLSSEPRERELASGSLLMQWEVTTDGEVRCSVPVVWFDPPASVRGLETGTEVVVSGVIRRRFYRAGAATLSRTEVVASRGARAGRTRAVVKIADSVIAAVDEATPQTAR
jgi:single-strand DNA-binding protein